MAEFCWRISDFSTETPSQSLALLVTMTAGTILLVWMGELITEYGIGNGISIIIFGGIIASLPSAIGGPDRRHAVGKYHRVGLSWPWRCSRLLRSSS